MSDLDWLVLACAFGATAVAALGGALWEAESHLLARLGVGRRAADDCPHERPVLVRRWICETCGAALEDVPRKPATRFAEGRQ